MRGQSAGVDRALAKNLEDLQGAKTDLGDNKNTAAFLKTQSI